MKKALILGMIIVSLGTMIGCSKSDELKDEIENSKTQIEETIYVDRTTIIELMQNVNIDLKQKIIINNNDLEVFSYTWYACKPNSNTADYLVGASKIKEKGVGEISISDIGGYSEDQECYTFITFKNNKNGKILFVADKFDKEGLKVKWSNWQEEGTQAEYVNSMESKNEQQEQ